MIDPTQLHDLMQQNTVKSYIKIRKIMLVLQNERDFVYRTWNNGNVLHGLIIHASYVTPSTYQSWLVTMMYAITLGANPKKLNMYGQNVIDAMCDIYKLCKNMNKCVKDVEKVLLSNGITFETFQSSNQLHSVHHL